MRFAIGATAVFAAALVQAQDEAESSTSVSVPKPTFTVSISPIALMWNIADGCA